MVGTLAELTQYLFNSDVVRGYLESVAKKRPVEPPSIRIEVCFSGSESELAQYLGDGNIHKEKESGVVFEIALDDSYREEYEAFLHTGEVSSLPIEYYTVTWLTFARKPITPRSICVKSTLVDSSSYRYQNGSDACVSRIIRESLDRDDTLAVAQAHRRMRDLFMGDSAVKSLNEKLNDGDWLGGRRVQLSVELQTKNAWENSLVAEIDETPFHLTGRGTQCIAKTELALSNLRARNAGVILLEEPENHLSHSNLNRLIAGIKQRFVDRQIIITTHSSFVANKLGLDKLILLNRSNDEHPTTRFEEVPADTRRFFEKISGYDTLRFLLCKQAILVEGASDELVIQKAFASTNGGCLPIQKGIDVISVGTAFLRYLDLAVRLKKPTIVVTDNDGSVEAVRSKYEEYLGQSAKPFIHICYDSIVDNGTISGFNYNTLEPKMLKANGVDLLNSVFSKSFASEDELLLHMRAHKTECALAVFETGKVMNYPGYILEAVRSWATG
jgi:putative ATP-dependent endonuclease of OLD family